MTEQTGLATPQLTVDDLRHKALHIRDMAESEARAVASERGTQIVAVGVVVIIAAISLAYYFGSRRARCYGP